MIVWGNVKFNLDVTNTDVDCGFHCPIEQY